VPGKDKEWLFSFYDFPAQHWSHLRTTNPIESTFATVRLRTQRTKGCGSHLSAKETSSRHRGFILDFYGFKPFRPHGRPVLAEEIARLLRSQIKPEVIFWRCVDVLIREKIEVPGYFPLADQILSAIKTQNQTLATTIERTLDTATRAVLDDLLTQEPLQFTPLGRRQSIVIE
jgi:hypothetical protein